MLIEGLSVQGFQSTSASSASFYSASPAPIPMGLDGVILFCPSPVPHEVEKQWVMMSTHASNAGCESPGQNTFPQVDGLLR